MKSLARVLIVKIVFTVLLWCIPLLLFPQPWFPALGIPAPEPCVFRRLLGAAYLALIVGYSFGLAQARKDQMPTGVVWTGIVSNGLAAAILFACGLDGAWNRWSWLGQVYMWFSAVATLGITVALLAFGRPWKSSRS